MVRGSRRLRFSGISLSPSPPPPLSPAHIVSCVFGGGGLDVVQQGRGRRAIRVAACGPSAACVVFGWLIAPHVAAATVAGHTLAPPIAGQRCVGSTAAARAAAELAAQQHQQLPDRGAGRDGCVSSLNRMRAQPRCHRPAPSPFSSSSPPSVPSQTTRRPLNNGCAKRAKTPATWWPSRCAWIRPTRSSRWSSHAARGLAPKPASALPWGLCAQRRSPKRVRRLQPHSRRTLLHQPRPPAQQLTSLRPRRGPGPRLARTRQHHWRVPPHQAWSPTQSLCFPNATTARRPPMPMRTATRKPAYKCRALSRRIAVPRYVYPMPKAQCPMPDARCARCRADAAGRLQHELLKARYWNYMLDVLSRAIDDLYTTCEGGPCRLSLARAALRPVTAWPCRGRVGLAVQGSHSNP